MSALLLMAVLAQAPAGDAPLAVLDQTSLVQPAGAHAWLVPMGGPDGGVTVCMDSPTAVADASSLVALRKENDELKTYATTSDPGWLRVVLVGVGALVVGGALTAGALSATGHLR